MDLESIGCKDVDWIHMVQDRDQWRDLENTKMNLRIPQKAGISQLTLQLLASQ
jgi:hypothetical protein